MIYLDEPNLDYIPSTRGIDVQNFETAMGRYIGVDQCVAVNSGTSALFLALKACGIGRGDKVLVPATTFIATANAVSYTGAKVVLSDVDSKYWCLSAKTKAKAVIPVCLYGECSFSFSVGYSRIILDAAESIERMSSDIDYVCHSFNGNKNMTTGGGGLIVGKNLDKIRQMINPGHYNGIGYNYGMTALSAMLGLEQLKLLDEHKAKKKLFNHNQRIAQN